MSDAKRLSDAVWTGNIAEVKTLIAAGADVNVVEGYREPPLHLAIEQMEIEIVRLLIAAGADIENDLGKNWPPLAHAVDIESDSAAQSGLTTEQVSTDLTELLIAAGAEPCERAIELAKRYGNHKALSILEEARRRSA